MSKKDKFAIIKELDGRQILFLKGTDDDGEPCITTKVMADVGMVSIDASGFPDKKARDKNFASMKYKPEEDIQGMFDSMDAMVDDMLGR